MTLKILRWDIKHCLPVHCCKFKQQYLQHGDRLNQILLWKLKLCSQMYREAYTRDALSFILLSARYHNLPGSTVQTKRPGVLQCMLSGIMGADSHLECKGVNTCKWVCETFNDAQQQEKTDQFQNRFISSHDHEGDVKKTHVIKT